MCHKYVSAMILCEFSFFPSTCDCAYVTPALCVSNAMMFQHEWDFVRFNVSVRLIRQIAGLSGKYRPSLPSFRFSFFSFSSLGCDSTSWPADGGLPSPNHSSARSGLCLNTKLRKRRRSSGVFAIKTALKLHLVFLWMDFSHKHKTMRLLFRLTTSPIGQLGWPDLYRATEEVSHLIGCTCECDDKHACISDMYSCTEGQTFTHTNEFFVPSLPPGLIGFPYMWTC